MKTTKFINYLVCCLLMVVSLASCAPVPAVALVEVPADFVALAPHPEIPQFTYIAVLVFENAAFKDLANNPEMPNLNRLAEQYALLTQYQGAAHPSLPNYIAMISGDTYGFDHNCDDCDINVLSLPDYIEATGRSWSTYQEDLPERCYTGDITWKLFEKDYVQKHNPFLFFSPIRRNHERCEAGVVPLSTIDEDIRTQTLPNYMFIVPNTCHDGHDCSLAVVDAWLGEYSEKLISGLDATGESYLVVITWDEDSEVDSTNTSDGGLFTVLISPQVKPGFQDDTPYNHYSLLKTVSASWGIPYLGHAADEDVALIVNPWK